MNIIRLLKKRIKDIQPNLDLLENIKKQCGIENVKVVKTAVKRHWLRVFVPIMACFVLAITCTSVIFTMPNEIDKTSYILVEMGPQLQFVAEDNIVVEQQGLNKEAQVLLLGCDYVDNSIDNVINDVVDNATELGMVAKGDEIKIFTITGAKENELKKTNLYSNFKSVQNRLGQEYQLTNSFANKEDLVGTIGDKYACSTSGFSSKPVNDLIEIYVNYDQRENLKYYYSINAEYDNIWQDTQLQLNQDVRYNLYKNLLDELQMLVNNIQSLQQSFNQELFDNIDGVVDYINVNFGDILGEFNIDDEYLNLVRTQLQDVGDEIDNIINSYYDEFDSKISQYKLKLYDEIQLAA